MVNKVINSVIYLTSGILLIFGPYTLFRVCDTSEKIMKCFWSTRAINAFGGLIALFGIIVLLARNTDSISLINLCTAAAAVISLLIPSFLIGGCANEMMACRSLTFPTVYLISAVVILFSIGNLIFIKTQKGKPDHAEQIYHS